MILHPRRGQLVRLHYRASLAHELQDRHALVERVGRGPGPINCLVRLRGGLRVVVSRGNLVIA